MLSFYNKNISSTASRHCMEISYNEIKQKKKNQYTNREHKLNVKSMEYLNNYSKLYQEILEHLNHHFTELGTQSSKSLTPQN